MERGRWMVSCGVPTCGVSGPKEPMEEGVNTATPFSRAISRILSRPFIWMSHARSGFRSATADSNAARLYMVSILYLVTISANPAASRTSAMADGPLSNNAPLGSAPGMYPATTVL